MRTVLAVVIFSFSLCISHAATVQEKIKHVIILMLENRSFDHMLGFLKKSNEEIDGCLPNADGCFNHLDPQDSATSEVTVDNTAVYVQVDPNHSISGTTQQVFGYPKGTNPPENSPATMDGFIASYTSVHGGNSTGGAEIMKCFAPDHVPVIANLSTEYGVFDGWFAAVPGPTMVNRAYAASATSHGMGTNDEVTIAKGLPQKTMFRQLLEMGLDYRVYYQDAPTVLQFKDMRHKQARTKYSRIHNIYDDLAKGDIPEFTWIEPAYFASPKTAATDQHPDHDVSLGEDLMKHLYEAVRASPIWKNTVFMITYDEHGGFFDHVAPPENVPNPDGLNSTDDPFDFTRLGVRIPTVVISPWVEKGSVYHATPVDTNANTGGSSNGSGTGSDGSSSSSGSSEEEGDNYSPSQYEHSSIVSTVIHKLFAPKPGHPKQDFLTKRDAWAKTFEDIFDKQDTPREDCPMQAPEVFSHAEHLLSHEAPEEAAPLPPSDGSLPLTHLQRELLAIMAGAAGEQLLTQEELDTWTEAQGSAYCEEKMNTFLRSSV